MGRDAGRLSDRVRDRVREDILTGALKPGAIVQVSQLAEQMNVSRTPAREALLSLESSGVLDFAPNRGFVVRSVTMEDVADIYVMRRLLEGATAERAATRATDEVRAHLQGINKVAHAQATDVLWDSSVANQAWEFHEVIARAAHSPRLLAAVTAIYEDSARIGSVGHTRPDRAEILAEHDEILAAILDRDSAEARRLMESHVDNMRRNSIAAVFS